jgi:hypothetical protein
MAQFIEHNSQKNSFFLTFLEAFCEESGELRGD